MFPRRTRKMSVSMPATLQPPSTAARRRRRHEQLEPRSRPTTTCISSLPRRRARRCSSKSTEEERPCASNFLCAAPPPFATPPASHPSRSRRSQPARLGSHRSWLQMRSCVAKDESGAEPQLCVRLVPRIVVHVRDGRVHRDMRAELGRARCSAATCERRRAHRD